MMENVDYDEAELARRKQQQIEYRNKKRTTSLFVFCATVYEIIITILIFVLFFYLSSLFLFRVIHTESSNVVFFTIVGSLIASFVAGFFAYKYTCRAIIKKFNLEDKLMEDALDHYKTTKEVKSKMGKELIK